MQVVSTTTQAQSAVGEAKVRAGRRDVEKAFERMRELQNRYPKRFPEMLVPLRPGGRSPGDARGARKYKAFESKSDVSIERVL
jgi:hypothetical protein